MTDPSDRITAFIGRLRELVDPAAPDRATLAELRRCLGRDLGRALYRVGWLFNAFEDRALEDALLVAALFAFHQKYAAGVNLGAAFRKLKEATGSDSVEKRFVALLDSEREDLDGRLRQAVALLKAKEIALDWEQLLHDLHQWSSPSRWIQHRWARAFWEERRAEPSSPEVQAATSTTPQ